MTNDHPDWPPQSTAEGATLRIAEGLQNPGNPRRAGLMVLGILGLIVLFVLVAVLLS